MNFCAALTRELEISNLSFLQRDITVPNPSRAAFDLIVCIDVLEHVVDYKATLRGFHQMLMADGMLYIHVPQTNQQRIFSRLKNWEHEGHVREGFEPGLLQNEVVEAGFRVREIRQTFGVFGKLAWELNHLALARSLVLAGLAFPATYALAKIDMRLHNERGLGVSILAQREPDAAAATS